MCGVGREAGGRGQNNCLKTFNLVKRRLREKMITYIKNSWRNAAFICM